MMLSFLLCTKLLLSKQCGEVWHEINCKWILWVNDWCLIHPLTGQKSLHSQHTAEHLTPESVKSNWRLWFNVWVYWKIRYLFEAKSTWALFIKLLFLLHSSAASKIGEWPADHSAAYCMKLYGILLVTCAFCERIFSRVYIYNFSTNVSLRDWLNDVNHIRLHIGTDNCLLTGTMRYSCYS